jgi:hypothetical protein
MKTTLIIVIIFTLLCSYSFAKTIHVPADIFSIQGGINLASDGDTVLVQPGTYIESINFNGKNIIVGSLMLTTQDTSYISQTIISGDTGLFWWTRESGVTFENGEDSIATIIGFTLTNSNSGLSIHNSNPHCSYLLIKENYGDGGGICFYYWHGPDSSVINLSDVSISNNEASQKGGGVFINSGN